MKKLNEKQINFWLNEKWHTIIKIKAAECNISIKEWIMRAMREKIERE